MSILRRRFGFFKSKKASSGQEPPVITITSQPQNQESTDGTATFSVSASVTQGATLSYQWQKSTDGGFNYSNVSGATGSTLNLSGLTFAEDEADKYRVIVSASGGATPVTSQAATLSIEPLITFSAQPSNYTTSEAYGEALFSVSAATSTGDVLSYQWQRSIDEGNNWANLSGEVSDSLSLSNLTYLLNDGNLFRCNISISGSNISSASSSALLIVYDSNTALNSWNSPSVKLPTGLTWADLCYSNELGLFVAVARGGTGDRIAISRNGNSWISIAISDNLWSVCWSKELGLFCAVGSSGVVLTSTNGFEWVRRTAPATNEYRKVRWIAEKGFFLACSSSSVTTNRFIKSSNGINWTGHSAPSTALNTHFDYSPSLDLFVATCYSSNSFFTSSNGENWTTVSVAASNSGWDGIVWSEERGKFVAASDNGNISTSSNGVTWNTASKGILFSGVSYSPELGIFTACSYSSSNIQKIRTSIDGENWTNRGSSTTSTFRRIVWVKEFGKFFTISESGGFVISSNYTADNYIRLSDSSTNLPATITYRGNQTSSSLVLNVSETLSGFVTYQWQKSTDGGLNYSNILGANSNELSLTQTERNETFDNNHLFRLKVFSANTGNSPFYFGVYSQPVQEDNIYAVNNWSTSSIDSTANWRDVTWSSDKGVFVAVASNHFLGTGGTLNGSTQNKIAVSSDGLAWEYAKNYSTSGFNILSVNYVKELGKFFATGSSNIFTSSDGINWDTVSTRLPSSDWGQQWGPLAYAPGIGMVVTSSATWMTNKVAKSLDGVNWTVHFTGSTTATNIAFWDISWSPQLNLFVIVGTNGLIRTSPNGETWTTRTSPSTNQFTSVTWSPELSLFVAVSNNGTNRVITSPDGINWTARVSADEGSAWRKIIWVSDLNMFIASAETGSATRSVMYSSNGINWTISNALTNSNKASIVWSPDLKVLVSVGASGTVRSISTPDIFTGKTTKLSLVRGPGPFATYLEDTEGATLTALAKVSDGSVPSYQWQTSTNNGTNWSDLSGKTDAVLSLTDLETENASSSNRSYRVVASSVNATNSPLISTGSTNNILPFKVRSKVEHCVENWDILPVPAGNAWNEVCWSPELGLFCAVGQAGTGTRVMTSPDGITWTIRTSAADNSWRSVCWSKELGLFCAVATSGTGNRVMTSPNGTTWTIRTSAADNNWNSVCWSKELGLFCAVATSGTGNRVMTSPNGTTWTTRTSAANVDWQSVCWSPTANGTGLFVAVGTSSTITGNKVMTSPNGITWTGNSNNNWNIGVCWSPELNLFVMVGSHGSVTVAFTSPDGTTWTSRSSNVNISNAYQKVCWSKELGLFCAVGNATSSVTTVGGYYMITSPDGISWTRRRAQDRYVQNWQSICWSPQQGRFVSVAPFNGLLLLTNVPFIPNPEFSLETGTYTEIKTTTITSIVTGASIYYTTDGSTPTASSTLYTGPVTVNSSQTIKAIAIKAGYPNSAIVSKQYTLNLTPVITITSQPENYYFSESSNTATFSVSASVTQGATLSYQWQVSADNGVNYSNISGATGSTLNLSGLTTSDINKKYRVIVSAGGGATPVTSESGVLGLASLADPTDRSSDYYNGQVTFSALASGYGTNPVYQWEESVDGGSTFSALTGETSSVLTISGLNFPAKQNNKYRVFVSGNSLSALSEPATLSYHDRELAVNNWTAHPTSQTSSFFRSVCWSPELGLFCAVAASGPNSFSQILTSPDGFKWTGRSAAYRNWKSVCWSPTANGTGLFVAVAEASTGSRVITSPDGITWTSRNASDNNNAWQSVCWSPELGLFVAVASSGSSNRVMTSPDGITWTARSTAGFDRFWRSVCWSPELGLFVAVQDSNTVLTSSNGINWTENGGLGYDIRGTSICWSPELGLFCAVGREGRAMTSPDGINWTLRTPPVSSSWNSVCWSPELGLFCAVAKRNSNISSNIRIVTSPDGISWTERNIPTIANNSDSNWESVCWSPELGMFCVLPENNGFFSLLSRPVSNVYRNILATTIPESIYLDQTGNATVTHNIDYTNLNSNINLTEPSINYQWQVSADNGVNYSNISGATGSTLNLSGLTTSDYSKIYKVQISGTGGNPANPDSFTSKNLPVYPYPSSQSVETWISRSAPNNNYTSVCWSPELGLFCAVGREGTGNRVMTSPDGITWTSRTSAADNTWRSVCWSPQLGLFVAVASSGTGNRVMTSPDGINWTIRTSAADNSWESVCWSPELGLFCAVAQSGTTGTRAMTSPDGINWTLRNLNSLNSMSVCWSPTANGTGLFVSVSRSVSGNSINTSPDGITWTGRSGPQTGARSQSVCWSPTANGTGLFVWISDSGYNTRLFTSTNGITWTTGDLGYDIRGTSICWSPELNLFCATGWNTTKNLILTSPNGINWTTREAIYVVRAGLNLSSDENWQSLCWSPQLGLFVAVHSSVMTSTKIV